MIRVLYVSTSTAMGGAEKTLHFLATGLDPKRFETAGVVSVKPGAEYAAKLKESGCPVFSLGLDSILHPSSLRSLGKIIEQTRPDIVHAILYQAMQLCRAAKRLRGGGFKLVSSPRVHYRSRSFLSLCVDRFLKSSDDLTLCESEASRDYLTRRLGYDPSRTIAIHNGIEPPPAAPREDRLRIRQQLGAGPEDIVLGTVGRLDRQKGHVYLLEAAAKLRVLHPMRCVIVGEGPAAPELKAFAEHLRITDYVRFVGRQPDVSAWHAAMDLFVLPSLWEGLPNALLEAMAAGLPIVATHVDGVPEAVQHGQNGLLCAPKDSQALFSAIQEMIVKPEFRQQMALAAKRSVAEKFPLGAMLREYQTAYERVFSPVA